MFFISHVGVPRNGLRGIKVPPPLLLLRSSLTTLPFPNAKSETKRSDEKTEFRTSTQTWFVFAPCESRACIEYFFSASSPSSPPPFSDISSQNRIKLSLCSEFVRTRNSVYDLLCSDFRAPGRKRLQISTCVALSSSASRSCICLKHGDSTYHSVSKKLRQ